MKLVSARDAARIIRQGGVAAYPTESCFGLGCDPKNLDAVRRILKIKRRGKDKGLIIISHRVSGILGFVDHFPDSTKQEILDSWPGPFTWLLPARAGISSWLTGNHQSIAVRITGHDQARKLCMHAAGAIVSTSANRGRMRPLKSAAEVLKQFGDEVDCVMEGQIGSCEKPSVIRDGTSGEIIRG